MVQWGQGRARALLSLADSMGLPWDNVDVQIAMIKQEMNGTYMKSINRFLSRYYNNATMQTIKDVDSAAEAWAAMYEGCICTGSHLINSHNKGNCEIAANGLSYQELKLRKQYAQRVYAAMTKRSGGAGEGGSFAGMTNSEILSDIFGASTMKGVMARYHNSYKEVEKEMTTIAFTDSTGRRRSVKCHQRVAEDLTNALNEISAAGFYINDAQGYVGRQNTSNSSSWSFHALGLAVDINPPSNPQFFKNKTSNEWIKQNYRPNVDPLAVTLQQYYIFKSYGFLWGRDFSNRPDIMHFVVGEVGQDGGNAWISQLCEGAQ